MPNPTPIALPSEGGSYVVDPDTGLPVLVERTQPATENTAPADADANPQPAE
jgi:hypothetical protein